MSCRLQTAATCLLTGSNVVWLGLSISLLLQHQLRVSYYPSSDAATPLNGPRLQSTIDSQFIQTGNTNRDALRKLQYISVPSLTHLLAIILHPRPDFPPDRTSLLVIDGINTLVDLDYPRFHQFGASTRTEQQKWQATRRYAVLGSLVNGLKKLAALNDIAVIVTTGCSTRGRNDSGLGLALVPGLGGSEWEAGIRSRMVMFRDFGGRFIGVQKCQSRSLISREEVGEVGKVFRVDTAENGSLRGQAADVDVVEPTIDHLAPAKIISSPKKPRKRVYDEIADSEGEDVDEYGWAETDEDVIATEGLGGGKGAQETGAMEPH